MRVLITGANGFVGRHLARLAADEGADVIGLSRNPAEAEIAPCLLDFARVDLRDAAQTGGAIRGAQPDRVFHLAAQAFVGQSWADPYGTIDVNVASTLHLLDAVQSHAPDARVLVAGSGEQYGPPAYLPVTEDHAFRPQNPYAVSKCAADLIGSFYADSRGLDVVRTRAFNHSGPGQHERYVVSSFARQIAAAEAAGRSSVTVATGDVRPSRDFTDVRDVVRAYWLALEHAPAGMFNVCSGRSRSVGDILAALDGMSELAVEQRTDSSLLRHNEVMEIRGSHEKLTEVTGWQPELPLERTLEDTLNYWRSRFSQAVAP